ncbi:MAG: hypothetical protein NTW64_04265 [Candidatus Omnitrophica bacterium]|nr:hypothetical protein [Candidatus Omnitrophota bacterium]
MELLFLLIFLSFIILGLSVALLLLIKPFLAIEMQRRFYEKINWKIEPISVEKERRNTQIMGLILLLILVTSFIIILVTNK